MSNPFSNSDKLYESNFAMLRHLENSINGIPNYQQLFQLDQPHQNNYIDKISRYNSDYKLPEVFDYSNPRSFNNASHFNGGKPTLNGDNIQATNSRGVVHLQHQDHHPKYFPVSDMLDNEHNCCICNKVFKDAHHLKIHMKEHYNKNSTNTTDHFEQSDKIDAVSLMHSTSPPYKCHICNLIFNSSDQLKSHEIIMHQPSPGYQCKFCMKSFEKTIQLKDHVSKAHGEEQEREYVCCECGGKFSNKHDLANHSMAVHGTLQCSECGAKFIQADLLQQHMVSHTEIKSFACTQCGMTFTKRSSLKQHIKISHNRVLSKCSECGETFNRVKELRRHLQVFHGKELDDSLAGSSISAEDHSAIDSNIEENNQHNTHVDQREESSASEDESLNQLNNILGIKSNDVTDHNVSFLDQLTDTGAMEFADYLKNQDNLSTPINKNKQSESIDNAEFLFQASNLDQESINIEKSKDKEFTTDVKIKQETLDTIGLTCIVCSLPFDTEEQLIEHLKEHLTCVMDADDSLLKPGPGRPRKRKRRQKIDLELLNGNFFSVDTTNFFESNICKDCGAVLSSPHSLLRHVQTMHTDDRPYVCCICHRSYARRDKFGHHIGRRHPGMFDYSCAVCDMTFPTWYTCHRHMRDKHLINCKQCSFTTHYEHRMQRHFDERHSMQKNHTCAYCGAGFRRRSNLIDHTRTHTGERPFKCPQCPKAFIRQDHMKTHFKAVHCRDQGLLCATCGRSFTTTTALSLHNRLRHTGDEQIDCQLCGVNLGEDFESRARHRRMHAAKNEHMCDRCTCWFSTRDGLVMHRAVRCGEKCRQCTKCLTKIEEGPRPPSPDFADKFAGKIFECTYCSWIFGSRYKLDRHLRTHTKEKPFICEKCDKGFTTSYGKSRHQLKVHTNAPDGQVKMRRSRIKNPDTVPLEPVFGPDGIPIIVEKKKRKRRPKKPVIPTMPMIPMLPVMPILHEYDPLERYSQKFMEMNGVDLSRDVLNKQSLIK